MRTVAIISLIVLLVLAGCSTTKYVCEDGSEVTDKVNCQTEDAAPMNDTPEETVTEEPIEPAGEVDTTEPKEEEVAPPGTPAAVPIQKDIEPDVQELLDEVALVKSYSYQFYGPKPYDEIVDIFVKGSLIKLVYRVPIKYNGLEFDTVYLDANRDNGKAYCEDTNRGPCINPNFEFSASYADFQHKLPTEWVDDLIDAKEVSSEYIGNRNTLKLEVTTTLGDGLMWIDDFYGMPVKVQIEGTEWEYRDFVYNSVTDEELEHQYIKPRPGDNSDN